LQSKPNFEFKKAKKKRFKLFQKLHFLIPSHFTILPSSQTILTRFPGHLPTVRVDEANAICGKIGVSSTSVMFKAILKA